MNRIVTIKTCNITSKFWIYSQTKPGEGIITGTFCNKPPTKRSTERNPKPAPTMNQGVIFPWDRNSQETEPGFIENSKHTKDNLEVNPAFKLI